MNWRRNTRGVTLVEVLVSLAAFGLFAAMVQLFSVAVLQGVRVLEVASEAQEAARIGVQFLVRDLRETGFNPTGAAWQGLSRAERQALRIARDLNGDGDANDANERVSYSLQPERHSLMRGLGSAPAQPMLGDVADDGLEFRYFDTAGAPIPVPPEGLSAAERARVRRIDLRLAIEIDHPIPRQQATIRSTQTASVDLRNSRIP